MPQSVALAALWMAGWLIATLGTTIAARELGRDVSVFVLMLLRALVATAILTPLVISQGDFAQRLTQFRLHLMRNILHYGAQYCWLAALLLIPLAEVIAIEFTTPIWVAILAAIFLGERLTAYRLAAIALGFAGIVAIVRPGLASVNIGQLLALTAAVGFAGTIGLTKFITRRDSALTVIFLMFAMQAVIGIVPAYITWSWPEPHNWRWVAVLGLAGTISHYCFSKALSLADASVVTPMDFLRVPVTAVVAYWLYGEGIDLYLLLGAALILAGNVVNLAKARAPA